MITTVDIVLFALKNNKLHVVLHARDKDPYKGCWALPGGWVYEDIDKNLDDTVNRVLNDKLGIKVRYVEQLGTFGSQKRDDRGWSVSISYYALLDEDELQGLKLFDLNSLPELSFDHKKIIAQAAERLKNKSSYSTLPLYLMKEFFTLKELQTVYETLMNQKIDNVTFRRRMSDLIEETNQMTVGNAHRPSKLYKAKGTIIFKQF